MKKVLVLMIVFMFSLYAPLLSAQEAEPPADPEPRAEQDWGTDMKGERNDYTVQVNLNYWFSDYSGELTYADVDVVGGTATIKGEKVDLVDELGLENEQAVPEIELRWRPGEKHMLLLSWYGADYGGDKKLDTNIEFAGYEFMTQTKFETTYRIDRIKLVHQYTPVMSDMASLDLIWGAEYYMLTVGYEGTEVTTGQSVDGDEFLPAPIPVVGIGGNLYLPYGFGAYASFSGMGGSFGDYEASYTDLDVGLTYDYKYLHAGVGYRMLTTKLDVEEDDEEFELDVANQGMLATIGVSF